MEQGQFSWTPGQNDNSWTVQEDPGWLVTIAYISSDDITPDRACASRVII